MRPALAAFAAAAVLIPGTALAQDDQGMRSIPGYQPSELELALDRIDGRMAEYAARSEAIGADASLSEADREAQLAALWGEYAPDVTALAAGAAEFGLRMAGVALRSIDIDHLVQSSLAAADVEGALAAADVEAALSEPGADAGGAAPLD